MSGSGEITRLLAEWSSGNQSALDDLVPIVYDELRRLASHYMRGERPGHLLQTTALVNEAYLRLLGREHVSCKYTYAVLHSRCSSHAPRSGGLRTEPQARQARPWDGSAGSG